MGEGGLEPPRSCDHRNLNPARLPIPPLALIESGNRTVGLNLAEVAPTRVRLLVSPVVSVVRGLEKRLERLLEGVAGRVFSGRLHPSEIAGKLAREADFARFDTAAGPATANAFTILVNPKDLTVDPAELEGELAAEMTRYTNEEGLRLEGPVGVEIEPSDEVGGGGVVLHVEVVPGPPVVWARLVAAEHTLDVGRNRTMIGRAPECDLVITAEDVSRRHALIWRESGNAWIRDLASSNGTTLDGSPVDHDPAQLGEGSVIAFARHNYRFLGV